ncbi:MAG TPA: aspartate 1-decarboxylase, partial [Thermaerobacter sp.]
LTVDPDLLEAAGMLPGEAVDVLNLHNGARLTTYLIEGRRGSGEVVANGAAARHIMPGDRVILLTYGLVPEEAAARHRPRIVTVGEGNRILTVEGQRR